MAWGRISGVALMLGVLLGFAALAGATEAQTSPERVVVTPGEGTSQTRFLFIGSGFTPGRTISVLVTPPDGVTRGFSTEQGAQLVWLVQPDGTFAMELIPAQRFPGAGPGHWKALFCSYAAPTCQLVDFDVYP